MNVYSIDVQMCGTAYVKANSEEEAMEKVKQHLTDEGIEVPTDNFISGRQYDDPNLPEVSLSPAMTIYGPWPGAVIYRAEEDVPDIQKEET